MMSWIRTCPWGSSVQSRQKSKFILAVIFIHTCVVFVRVCTEATRWQLRRESPEASPLWHPNSSTISQPLRMSDMSWRAAPSPFLVWLWLLLLGLGLAGCCSAQLCRDGERKKEKCCWRPQLEPSSLAASRDSAINRAVLENEMLKWPLMPIV